jgi:hypothetical protein
MNSSVENALTRHRFRIPLGMQHVLFYFRIMVFRGEKGVGGDAGL